jgi:RNA polymerase sigma-70 factor (ECF subfamily)
MPNSPQSDAQLFAAFQKGDKRAFEKIYQSYFSALVFYGFKVCPDKLLVENAIQDLFVELWRRREYISEVDNLKFYLIKSLRNQLIRNQRHNPFDRSEDIDDFLDYLGSLSEEQSIVNRETVLARQLKIQTALEKLSPRQKEVIHLRFYQNLALDEIAELLQLPKQVIKNLLSKSYAVLRIYLKSIGSLVLAILWA